MKILQILLLVAVAHSFCWSQKVEISNGQTLTISEKTFSADTLIMADKSTLFFEKTVGSPIKINIKYAVLGNNTLIDATGTDGKDGNTGSVNRPKSDTGGDGTDGTSGRNLKIRIKTIGRVGSLLVKVDGGKGGNGGTGGSGTDGNRGDALTGRRGGNGTNGGDGGNGGNGGDSGDIDFKFKKLLNGIPNITLSAIGGEKGKAGSGGRMGYGGGGDRDGFIKVGGGSHGSAGNSGQEGQRNGTDGLAKINQEDNEIKVLDSTTND
ncbi:hypothetical protein [Reichenbachiella sp.]